MMKGYLRDLEGEEVLNGPIQDVIDRLVVIRETLTQEGGETIHLHFDSGIMFDTEPELYLSYSKQEG